MLKIFQPRFRELIVFQAYAGLRAEAAQNYLSFLWWGLEPMLSMSVYYLVFGLLMQRGTPDFVPFLLIGLVTWQWLASTINHSMGAIVAKRTLMSQVDLPKAIFPTVIVCMDVVKFSCVFLLLLGFLWIYGFAPNIHFLALIPVLLIQLTLVVTFSYLVAAIVPFFPDVRFLLQAVLQLAFFGSGILFDGASIPVKYQQFFYLNPMANLIDAYRAILMHQRWPDWNALGVVFCVGMLGMLIGYAVIAKYDHHYPRIVSR